ncbi:L-lactate dehydrogenase-like isoform X2 [Nilaparvata lugens]|uniref:L-lactate dehydrogenase-like isoform X2 n=1 Tax=Nilaparvata lugens TaxID=108931 RepID=UPI00193E6693|nr:L-lactate dehydrogenase-like isoform X2 [Nilaparvata lugens]
MAFYNNNQQKKSLSDRLLQELTPPVHYSETKISVIGAGQVGMACAFSILTQNVSSDLALVDYVEDKLLGELLDLQHGAFFMNSPKISASSTYEVTANSRICIITAGARQREGESRLALVQRNVEIMKAIVPQLMKYSPNTTLLVVSNPVDILTWVVWKLSGLPRHKVLGSGTNLDSSRFRFLLSQSMKVSVKNVHAFIVGEHGDSSVPVWSGVNVAGVKLRDLDPNFATKKDEQRYDEIHRKVVESAYEIIRLKGYTSWAIGLSVSQICDALLKNQHSIHCVSLPVKNCYGIDEDVFLSLPAVLGEAGVSHIVKIHLNEEEEIKLRDSAKTIAKVTADIKW